MQGFDTGVHNGETQWDKVRPSFLVQILFADAQTCNKKRRSDCTLSLEQMGSLPTERGRVSKNAV